MLRKQTGLCSGVLYWEAPEEDTLTDRFMVYCFWFSMVSGYCNASGFLDLGVVRGLRASGRYSVSGDFKFCVFTT